MSEAMETELLEHLRVMTARDRRRVLNALRDIHVGSMTVSQFRRLVAVIGAMERMFEAWASEDAASGAEGAQGSEDEP